MVLYALANVARQNSEYGEAYMDRIAENSAVLAMAMQLSPQFEDKITDNFIEAIKLAAPLCDLGNVAVSEDILQKKGSLNQHETIKMQKHTLIGEKILADIEYDGYENEFISYAIDICKCHHENWDGTGYPSNIAGYAIPLSAQIVRVSNVYTALTENRVYRSAYTPEEALEIMESGSGSKFNSDIFDICKKIYKQFR